MEGAPHGGTPAAPAHTRWAPSARPGSAALLAVLLTVCALAGAGRLAVEEIAGDRPTRASDALPLYLSACAVADGMDPTRKESLAAAYDARGLKVGAATFSNLYPATAGALLRPACALDWEGFTAAWRALMLTALLAQGAVLAGMLSATRACGRAAALAGGAGLATVLVWHPLAREIVRLGQVNVVLAALCGGAMVAVLRARDGAAGALLAVGALVKLVPGGLLLPALAARRWRVAAAMGIVGLLGALLALSATSPARMLEAVRETLAFQAAIDPDWLVGEAPVAPWMQALGFARHAALQPLTLGAALLVPVLRPTRDVTVSAMGLVCAWLGADAAGFHVLYLPLALPALAWVGTRPRTAALALLGWGWLAWEGAPGRALPPEARAVLVGLLLWSLAAARLVAEALAAPADRGAWGRVFGALGGSAPERDLAQGYVALAGVLAGVALVGAQPGEGPRAAPLPEGVRPEGTGFIVEGERVPGGDAAPAGLGAGMERAASTLARPGTIRALQEHMRAAPAAWDALAERYPARRAELVAVGRKAPRGVLKTVPGTEVRAWLRDERHALERFAAEGLDVAELRAAHDDAWASGLGEEGYVPPVAPGERR